MSAWLELFRSLGQALIALAKAELEAVGEELAASGKRLTGALVLFGAAAAVAFWTVADSCSTPSCRCSPCGSRSGRRRRSPAVRPSSPSAVLAGIGVVRLRRLEGPARTLARHLEDHREWWNNRLLADGEAPPARRLGPDGGSEKESA